MSNCVEILYELSNYRRAIHKKCTSKDKDDSTGQDHWVRRDVDCACVYMQICVHLTFLFMQSKGVPQFYGLYFAMGIGLCMKHNRLTL